MPLTKEKLDEIAGTCQNRGAMEEEFEPPELLASFNKNSPSLPKG